MSSSTTEQKCRQAYACLAQAQQQPEQQQALLKQSLHLYLEAVDLAAPGDVSPYLGAAFVLGSVGLQEDAWGLLNQAKKIAPVNMRVEQMKRQLERLAKRQEVKVTAPLNPLNRDSVELLRHQSNRSDEQELELDALLNILIATDEQLQKLVQN